MTIYQCDTRDVQSVAEKQPVGNFWWVPFTLKKPDYYHLRDCWNERPRVSFFLRQAHHPECQFSQRNCDNCKKLQLLRESILGQVDEDEWVYLEEISEESEEQDYFFDQEPLRGAFILRTQAEIEWMSESWFGDGQCAYETVIDDYERQQSMEDEIHNVSFSELHWEIYHEYAVFVLYNGYLRTPPPHLDWIESLRCSLQNELVVLPLHLRFEPRSLREFFFYILLNYTLSRKLH